MRWFLVLGVIAALPGCTRDIDYNKMQIGDDSVIIARPTSRLITERRRFDNTVVFCTEPSPDVAAALARSGSLAASGGAPGGPSANLSGAFGASETLTALQGRTAGVVALRDGLYFACQAYANGIIGQNSYAMILSQYGRLLTDLVGSGAKAGDGGKTDAAATAATSPSAGPGGVVLTVVGGSMTAPQQAGKATATPPTQDKPSTPARNGVLDGLMLVACIEENDPTRLHQNGIANSLLARYCDPFLAQLLAPPPRAPR